MSYILKLFPGLFFKSERIIRIIYSDNDINPNTNNLRGSFFSFRVNPQTRKKELSTNRFEANTILQIRELGHYYTDGHKRNYYGVACTTVKRLASFKEYKIKFTPSLKIKPNNYTHTDIYDMNNYESQQNVANPADVNLRRDELKKIWKVCPDVGDKYTRDSISD